LLLHNTRASVLVARGTTGDAFPRRVVAGVDGSAGAARALAVARALGARFDVPVEPLAAVGGEAADALVAAADDDAALIVVGSRGLHGWKAVGSVSERVAHRASCSVLVVKPPPAAG
jgi:nucleotide-binding universal stress UspA family protein